MDGALVQILSPKKRIDILRDVMDAKAKGRPYSIVFCGVNGVGKSTNLAKVSELLLCISIVRGMRGYLFEWSTRNRSPCKSVVYVIAFLIHFDLQNFVCYFHATNHKY